MKKISILINADDKLGHISPEIYGHFSSISEDVSTTVYMWVKIHLFRIQTE